MSRPEIAKFTFPIAKAEYLLNFETAPNKGGDKRKFWREVMGFDRADLLRRTILDKIEISLLHFQKRNQYGETYRAVLTLTKYLVN